MNKTPEGYHRLLFRRAWRASGALGGSGLLVAALIAVVLSAVFGFDIRVVVVILVTYAIAIVVFLIANLFVQGAAIHAENQEIIRDLTDNLDQFRPTLYLQSVFGGEAPVPVGNAWNTLLVLLSMPVSYSGRDSFGTLPDEEKRKKLRDCVPIEVRNDGAVPLLDVEFDVEVRFAQTKTAKEGIKGDKSGEGFSVSRPTGRVEDRIARVVLDRIDPGAENRVVFYLENATSWPAIYRLPTTAKARVAGKDDVMTIKVESAPVHFPTLEPNRDPLQQGPEYDAPGFKGIEFGFARKED